MKAIAIVGFKKSGKTTLALKIAKALINKNYRVAVLKHSSKAVEHELSDTDKFLKEIGRVALLTPESTEIMFQAQWDLKDVVPLLSADFLVIEGFKSLKYFPKVYCLKDKKEKELLDDGLGIFSAGLDASLQEEGFVDYLINEEKDLSVMVELIEQKGFFLPNKNCGKCGYENCYELARAIVRDEESPKKCIYAQDYIDIKVNGKTIFLNPFMSQLYQSLIYSILAPLKDIDSLEQAVIEIKVDTTDALIKKRDN